MVTSSHTSPSLIVSPLKFQKMVISADISKIYELLVDHPMLFPCYLHFSALSHTLKHQEILLKQTEEELSMAFWDMVDHDFYNAFAFFITRSLTNSNNPHHHNPLHLNNPPCTDTLPCFPLNITSPLNHCLHPLVPHLLNLKGMAAHLHKKYLCPPIWEEMSDMWLSQNYE